MKKFKILLFVFIVSMFGFTNFAHASLNIDTQVDVPTGCTAVDTDGVSHPYSGSYLAVCALEAALQNGSITNADLSNQYPSFGLFVTAFNGVLADSNSQYWAIYQNGNFASAGITMLSVVAGDTINFQLQDFSGNNTGDQVTLHIHSLSGEVLPGLGGSPQLSSTFSVPLALAYLKNAQHADGSFGGDMYTDWAAVALGSLDGADISKDSLINYFKNHAALSPNLTDNERHAMALLALGQNPYSFAGVNYIAAIAKSFDGVQFGNASLVNDDIFALVPLASAGYSASDDLIAKDIQFILSKQNADGSWDEDVDMTAAGVQSLQPFPAVNGVSAALNKAGTYLAGSENKDGSFGNVSSTSWALQAMNALSLAWNKNGKSGLDYLGFEQAADGAAINSAEALANRIWATSYAIPGALGKPWSAIFKAVARPMQIANIPVAPQIAPAKTPAKNNEINSTNKNLTDDNTAPSTGGSAQIPMKTIAIAILFLGGLIFFHLSSKKK